MDCRPNPIHLRLSRTWLHLLLLLWLAMAAAPLHAADETPAGSNIAALDLRVATLGEALAVAAHGLCTGPVARTGMDLHSRAQYGRLTAQQATTMFPAANGVAVLLVVPGSPADRAGLRSGDGLIAMDGVPVPVTAASARPDYASTRDALDRLDAALADGVARLHVRRSDGSDHQLLLHGINGCPTRFQMDPGGGLEALADGLYVRIGQTMVETAADDDVLAASIAHELAHNILHHRQRQNAAGMRRGLARMFGRSAALSRAAEAEADRLTPWLMARAGRDPGAALRWLDLLQSRIGPSAPTHPSWARRHAIINEQLLVIAARIAEGRSLDPPFDTINPGPLVPDGE